MTYNTATSVRSYLLPDGATVTGSPVILVVRYGDGEVRLVTCSDYRAAQRHSENLENDGASVLMAIEGEDSALTGTASVWVAR